MFGQSNVVIASATKQRTILLHQTLYTLPRQENKVDLLNTENNSKLHKTNSICGLRLIRNTLIDNPLINCLPTLLKLNCLPTLLK